MQRECKTNHLLFVHKAEDHFDRAAENIVATKIIFFILLKSLNFSSTIKTQNHIKVENLVIPGMQACLIWLIIICQYVIVLSRTTAHFCAKDKID
jgi:hypothetical protein